MTLLDARRCSMSLLAPTGQALRASVVRLPSLEDTDRYPQIPSCHHVGLTPNRAEAA